MIAWDSTDDESGISSFTPTTFSLLPTGLEIPSLDIVLEEFGSALGTSNAAMIGDTPDLLVFSGSGQNSGTYIISGTPVDWDLSLNLSTRESTFSFTAVPEPAAYAFMTLVASCVAGFQLWRKWTAAA